MMNRRDLLKAALAAGAALPAALRAATLDPVLAAFEARRAGVPWTLGFEGLQADAEPMPLQMPLQMRGRWPEALRGDFYRIGPARHALGGQRYHHWFDGDGMLQRYRISAAGIEHRGRFVRTEKFVEETRAGHFTRAAFGTNPPGAAPIGSPDQLNVANTSVIAHGGELLALWEGGSATVIEPQTLDTRGPKVWRADYAGMAFSAHPKREPDGTLWNFGVASFQGMLSIYRIAADGALLKATTFKVPDVAMVHDFAVTARHLVFLLPPLVFDAERVRAGSTFLDAHVWKPDQPMRVLVVDKNDLERRQWLELPTGFVFHIGNAWDDGAGHIRLDYVRAPSAWQATVGIPQIMQGRFEPLESTVVAQVHLDLAAGRATQTLAGEWVEFPRVDPRVVARRHQQLYLSARSDGLTRPGWDTVLRCNTGTGAVDRYSYGADVMVEEHLFVPRPGAAGGDGREGDGWLVGTALDLSQHSMLLSVFDAQRLADGPIAQARLARPMPLGLHGTFVAA